MFDPRIGSDGFFDDEPPHPLRDTVVRFPTDDMLNDEEYLWDVARRLGDLPLVRRDIPDWISEGFFSFPGKVVDESGAPVELGDDEVDQAFSNEDTFRWVSDFLRMEFLNPKLRKQRVQNRVLKRLRLIVAALEIEELLPTFTDEQLAAQHKLRWQDRNPSTLDRPRPQPARGGADMAGVLHYNDFANLTEIANEGIAQGIGAAIRHYRARLRLIYWKLFDSSQF